MVLTNFPHDPLLDLDPWVGQRQASYRFALSNGVTGEHLGDIHPIRYASLSHSSQQTVKRQLTIALGAADTSAINTLTDRINVYMYFPDGTEYPLGRYMFTDASRQVFTSGRLGNMLLTDEMFLVDQQITAGINGVGLGVTVVIQRVLEGLPITYELESAPFMAAESWGIGTNRGSILESLSISGDYWSPWFDNNGVLQFKRTFNPADVVPDFNFDDGYRVLRSSIIEADDLLVAPNTFIVISNNSTSPGVAPVIGRASVPPDAPHSAFNRGFEIVQTMDLQISDTQQAGAVAQGLVNRQTIFERVSLTTAPDPRFDGNNVVRWQGSNWLDLSWSLTLQEGAPMSHVLRRSYRGEGVVSTQSVGR